VFDLCMYNWSKTTKSSCKKDYEPIVSKMVSIEPWNHHNAQGCETASVGYTKI
jgi:hypothetical protein